MPPNVTFADIDRDTGQAAGARLPARHPRVVHRRHRAGADVRTPQVLTRDRHSRSDAGTRGAESSDRESLHLCVYHCCTSYNWRTMSQEVFEALTQALDRGEDAALVTIVSAQGSTPQRVGAKMLVFAGRPHRGHHRRRLLRERRVLEGQGSAAVAQAAAREVRPHRRLRAGDRADLRRQHAGLHRAAGSRRRIST